MNKKIIFTGVLFFLCINLHSKTLYIPPKVDRTISIGSWEFGYKVFVGVEVITIDDNEIPMAMPVDRAYLYFGPFEFELTKTKMWVLAIVFLLVNGLFFYFLQKKKRTTQEVIHDCNGATS